MLFGVSLRRLQQLSVDQVGSGSLPVESVDSMYVVLQHESMSVDDLAARFRDNEIPVIGRIHEGSLIMDMRTIYEEDAAHILKAAEAISQPKTG